MITSLAKVVQTIVLLNFYHLRLGLYLWNWSEAQLFACRGNHDVHDRLSDQIKHNDDNGDE